MGARSLNYKEHICNQKPRKPFFPHRLLHNNPDTSLHLAASSLSNNTWDIACEVLGEIQIASRRGRVGGQGTVTCVSK